MRNNNGKNNSKVKKRTPTGGKQGKKYQDPGSNGTGKMLLSFIVDHWGQIVSVVLLVAGICALAIISGPSHGFVIGQPAPESYRSPVDFQYLDRAATRRKREQKRYEAPLVFRDNFDHFRDSAEGLQRMLETGDVEHIDPFVDERGFAWEIGAMPDLLRENKDALLTVLDEMSQLLIVSDLDWGENAPRQPESVIWRSNGEERRVTEEDVVVLSPDNDEFMRLLAPVLSGLDPDQRLAALEFVARVVNPTARLDIQGSEQAAGRAADIPPVRHEIRRGDILVRKGNIVGVEEIRRLRVAHRKHLDVQRGGRFLVQRVGGALLLLALFGWVFAQYYLKNRPGEEIARRAGQCFALVLLVLVLLATAGLCIAYGLPIYLVPLPALIMIFSLIFGQRFAFVISAFFPAAIALLAGSVGVDYPVFMIGGMAAALLTVRVRTRGHLIRSGLVVGLVQGGALVAFGLLNPQTGSWDLRHLQESPLLINAVLAMGNGLLSGFLVTILLPTVERLFEVTTDIRLLEWSDPNQPLLQRLLLEAPGTYHHSMVIGSLAADAAEAVGANPLLARVSAYFHDVGKLKKPEYFSENVPEGGTNPHDELAPTMSKLIITAHPRDGADMAARSGLPPAVQDIILQSHGTTMTGYFWDVARQRAGEDDSPPDADSFRYKLPKPLSKEAACVMLADAVESATRSLETPGAGKIQETVNNIILDRLHDGQFDDSGLTIPDLSRLEKALTRGLNAVFHKRVKYPEQENNGNGKR